MASGPGKGQDDPAQEPVHGHGQREESPAGATSTRAPSAAAADVSSPPPPPSAPDVRLQERAREQPGDGGGGADGSSSAASGIDRKGKKVAAIPSPASSTPVSASSGSSTLYDADAASPGAVASSSAAGGEADTWCQQEMAEMVMMARNEVKRRAERSEVMGHFELEQAAIKKTLATWVEAGERKKQAKVTHWPGKKKSIFSKVKHYLKNKFLGRKRRQLYLSNQNSTECWSPKCWSPKPSASPYVDYQILPIAEAITFYWHLENAKAQDLSRAYSGFRPVKGDGECFYRSFIFSYLEQVLDRQDTYEEQRLLDAVKSVARQHADLGLTSAGFSRSRIAFEELIEQVKGWKSQGSSNSEAPTSSYRKQNLLGFFNTSDRANDIFSFLRSVIAIWICSHREDYEHLIPGDEVSSSLEDWCDKNLASGQYTDHVLMMALAQALEVPLHVVQIQGPDQDIYTGAGGHEVSRVTVTVLYSPHPGHYNIIYPLPPAESSSEQTAQGETPSYQTMQGTGMSLVVEN